MRLKNCELNVINVTFVFQDLNRDYISRDHIRGIVDDKPIITDLPDVLVVIYPQQEIQAIFEGRRVMVNLAVRPEVSYDVDMLASIAIGVLNSVKGSNLVAYGFNFHGAGQLEGIQDVGSYFKNKFFREQAELESAFGSIFSVAPRFGLRGSAYDINVSLEPHDNNPSGFGFHFNFHKNRPAIPNVEQLGDEMRSTKGLIKELLEKI